MQNENESSQAKQNQESASLEASFWKALDLESILLFLVGVATFAFGAVALVRWLIERWQLGIVFSGVAISVALVLSLLLLVLLVRCKRRILKVGMFMFCVGLVAYTLASFGYSLPASWFS